MTKELFIFLMFLLVFLVSVGLARLYRYCQERGWKIGVMLIDLIPVDILLLLGLLGCIVTGPIWLVTGPLKSALVSADNYFKSLPNQGTFEERTDEPKRDPKN